MPSLLIRMQKTIYMYKLLEKLPVLIQTNKRQILMVEELEDLSSLGVGPGRDTHYQQPTDFLAVWTGKESTLLTPLTRQMVHLNYCFGKNS